MSERHQTNLRGEKTGGRTRKGYFFQKQTIHLSLRRDARGEERGFTKLRERMIDEIKTARGSGKKGSGDSKEVTVLGRRSEGLRYEGVDCFEGEKKQTRGDRLRERRKARALKEKGGPYALTSRKPNRLQRSQGRWRKEREFTSLQKDPQASLFSRSKSIKTSLPEEGGRGHEKLCAVRKRAVQQEQYIFGKIHPDP